MIPDSQQPRGGLGWALACTACMALVMLIEPVTAVDLYETDFESFTAGEDQLVDVDGWVGSNVGEAVHGIDDGLIEGLGKTAFLGFNPPSSDFVSVSRAVGFDPIGAGIPVVEFFALIGVADSTNGEYDRFYISIYNRTDDLLGSIVFDNTPDDFGVLRHDGKDLIHTGELFVNDSVQALFVSIDYATNTWSANLDGLPLFSGEPFNAAGAALDLGSIAAEWELTVPGQPGDNWLLFDEWTITARGDGPPPASPYETWRKTHFGDTPVDDFGDPDHDGLSNLFEFGIGTDPLVSTGLDGYDSVPGGILAYEAGHVSFIFECVVADLLASGVTLEIVQSTTLQNGAWSAIAAREGNEPWSGPAADAGKLSVEPAETGKSRVRLVEDNLTGIGMRYYSLRVIVKSPD